MNHISAIREKLFEQGLDAVLILNEKNIRYACGFPFSDGAVVLGRQKTWLITDSRYIEAAAAATGDCAEVILYDRSHPLRQRIRRALIDESVSSLGIEEGHISYAVYRSLEQTLDVKLEPAQGIFTALRASKSQEELKYMRQAQHIAELALEDTLHIIRPGLTEQEVASELVYRMLRHGGEGTSFDPIVVTGRKTSLPHGVPGGVFIKAGDFVTMDFGCTKNGYCSDMTRTVAVCGVDEEMSAVYSVVLKAQLAGIAAARAGIPGKEIDGAARQVIDQAGFGAFFCHGFGHSLGLDIHEGPNANPGGETVMPVGAVISAEPGIYLPGRFGVRIEDVVVLNENGCELITTAPKELLILQKV